MTYFDQKILRVALAAPLSNLNPVNKSCILQTLCESNFHKLLLLAPDLLRIEYSATAKARGLPKLYIRIMDRKPYTLTIELTHRFESDNPGRVEPRVKIRVYLDAKSAEVLRDATWPPIAQALRKNPAPEAILEHKWTINYFLKRWLDHCIEQGYRFDRSETAEEISL